MLIVDCIKLKEKKNIKKKIKNKTLLDYIVIDEYKDIIDWNSVSNYIANYISSFESKKNKYIYNRYIPFINRYRKKLNWRIIESKKIPEKFIYQYEKSINLKNINYQRKYSIEFIDKFKNKLDWKELSSYVDSIDFLENLKIILIGNIYHYNHNKSNSKYKSYVY